MKMGFDPTYRRGKNCYLAGLLSCWLCGSAVASVPITGQWGGVDELPVVKIQVAPNSRQLKNYNTLQIAAHNGDVVAIEHLYKNGTDLNITDPYGRTPLMIAAFGKQHLVASLLIKLGADLNRFENDQYDALTIAAVANDAKMVKLLIAAGADATLTTSRYEGTALIAAAHLGHVDVVKALIAGKSKLDHVNNLGWTALIEAIVLGDGGARHTEIVRALVVAGANVNLPDSDGLMPLAMAKKSNYTKIIAILKSAGAKVK